MVSPDEEIFGGAVIRAYNWDNSYICNREDVVTDVASTAQAILAVAFQHSMDITDDYELSHADDQPAEPVTFMSANDEDPSDSSLSNVAFFLKTTVTY